MGDRGGGGLGVWSAMACRLKVLPRRRWDSNLTLWFLVIQSTLLQQSCSGAKKRLFIHKVYIVYILCEQQVMFHFRDGLGFGKFLSYFTVKYLLRLWDRFVEQAQHWIGETIRKYCCLYLWPYPFLLHFLCFLMVRSQRASKLFNFLLGPHCFSSCVKQRILSKH